MHKTKIQITPRKIEDSVYALDIVGEMNTFAQLPLMTAYEAASAGGAKVFLLNFTGMGYMNSTGIGLLVMLLMQIKRQKQTLAAYGIGEHYRQIFHITQLDEAIELWDSENEAVAALQKVAVG